MSEDREAQQSLHGGSAPAPAARARGRREDALHRAVQASDAATLVLDGDLRVERYSPAAAGLFALSSADVGRSLAELLRRIDQDALLSERPSDDEPLLGEIPFESAGRWYRVAFAPRPNEDGFVASFADVTRQKRVEQALAVERDAARAYLNVAGVIVVVLDRDRRIVFVNQRGCELLGCAGEEEVLGMDWIGTFLPERDRAETQAVLEALWSGSVEGAGSNENWIVTMGGEERLIEWSNAALRDPAGAVRAVVGTGIDVTERRQAEEALRQSETEARQQAALVEALYRDAPVGIALIDRAYRVVHMNRRLADLNGYAYEEASGRPLQEIVSDIAAQVSTFVDRVFETREPVLQAEVRGGVPAAGDDMRTWLLNCSPVRGESGAVEFVQAIVLDVTGRRRLEAEVLRVAEEERHRIGRDLHDGLGSHLTGLGMMVRSLARGLRRGEPVTPEQLEEVAQLIGTGAEQARALARGLDPADVMGEGLPRALAHLAADTAALADLTCTFESPSAPPALWPATATQLYWIAQEAVTNALKHADATHIRISLDVEEAAGEQGHALAGTLVLTVRDDGRGLDDARAEIASEHGMGLRTMTYRAHLIGARLDVASAPEEGVTVTCRLPLAEAAVPSP